MGYLIKNFSWGHNLCIVNLSSDNLQSITNTFRSRIFGFLPSKQNGIGENSFTAGRPKHFIHIKAEKMPLHKYNAHGSKTNQAMDTHLKHTEGKDVSLQTTVISDTKGKEFRQIATILVFDIETTGFSNRDKIIEFACRDITGGKYSTFQSLVNPECTIQNQSIHGISNKMVNKPDVPRWRDLAPILMGYVKSRQKPGGPVLWVAHNARRFDARFLAEEFNRCSLQIPSDWLFLDTLPLAREVMCLSGSKPTSARLSDLREHYKIPLLGSAHRAMSDVHILTLVLQKLSFELKLPVSGLLEKAFTVSDIRSK